MLNRAQIIGHLGRDPESRYLPDGTLTVQLAIATTEKWKDKSGNRQEATTWHRCVVWARLAEIAAEYLRKGALVYVEGRIDHRKWTDKEGQERYTTEIRVEQLRMLSGRKNDDISAASAAPAKPATARPVGGDGLSDDDDIPF